MPDLTFSAIRYALNITISAAAARLCVSFSTYVRWERGGPADPLEAWAAVATGEPCQPKSPAAIRSARRAAGLTQEQAAELAGVERVAWGRWECGQARAPAWRLVLFAARLPPSPATEAPPSEPWEPPSREVIRDARRAAGLTPEQASALVYLPRLTDWEAAERPDLDAPLSRRTWELWQYKSVAPLRAAPGLPQPGALAAMRRAAGMTQAQAATAVDATRHAWEAWESGRNPINRAAWELWLYKVSAH